MAIERDEVIGRQPGPGEPCGWGDTVYSRKWHFFGPNGFSLCGRFMKLTHELAMYNHDSPDNCAACRKKLPAYLSALSPSPHQQKMED